MLFKSNKKDNQLNVIKSLKFKSLSKTNLVKILGKNLNTNC